MILLSGRYFKARGRQGVGAHVPSIENVDTIPQKMYVAYKLTISTPGLRIRIKMIMPVDVSSICY